MLMCGVSGLMMALIPHNFCLGIHLELFPTVAAHFKSNQNLETLMEHVPWMKCQGIAIELTKSIMSCSWTLGHYGPVVCLKWYMI